VAVAAALLQASIYDVPGGYRAVMFDRFSGVKDQVWRPRDTGDWLTYVYFLPGNR
jgi:hypothetical protein